MARPGKLINDIHLIIKLQFLLHREHNPPLFMMTNQLMLFVVIISVVSVSYMRPITTLCVQSSELISVTDSGIHSYHWALSS
jgi:hypothetical protein